MRQHREGDRPQQLDEAEAPSGEQSIHDKARMHRALKRRQARQAAEQGTPGKMDPSVAALFRAERSTDEEMGTDAAAVKEQAEFMRLALQKHLSDYGAAVKGAMVMVTAAVAGMGKVKHTPDASEKIAKLAKTVIKLAWGACGGAAQVAAVVGIAKEELLGDMDGPADKAYEFVKGKIEKAAGEASIEDVMKDLEHIVTVNASHFVEHGRLGVSRADAGQLAKSWRLISGTRDNMTHQDGSKLHESEKVTVTTEMLESLTGICVNSAFEKQLTATVLQQARVTMIETSAGGTQRAGAINTALTADPMGEVDRLAAETGQDRDMAIDDAERARVHQ